MPSSRTIVGVAWRTSHELTVEKRSGSKPRPIDDRDLSGSVRTTKTGAERERLKVKCDMLMKAKLVFPVFLRGLDFSGQK